MPKKFLLSAVVATLIIFNACENVSAKDIWIASKGDTIHYYIMAETFQKTVGENFTVIVKSVHNQGNNITRNRTWDANTYEFELSPEMEWQFRKENPGVWLPISQDWVAAKICNFFINHFD